MLEQRNDSVRVASPRILHDYLVGNAQAAMMAAIEIYNKPHVFKYREEMYSYPSTKCVGASIEGHSVQEWRVHSLC